MKSKILDLIEEELKKINITIDDIEYIKENDSYYLRIVIDKEGFITSEDCVKVTKIINPILDKANLIEDSYILDVCSKERG